MFFFDVNIPYMPKTSENLKTQTQIHKTLWLQLLASDSSNEQLPLSMYKIITGFLEPWGSECQI